MKLLSLAVVFSFFSISVVNAQVLNEDFKDKLFFKGGYGYSFRSSAGTVKKERSDRTGTNVYPSGWVSMFSGGAGYEFSEMFHLEASYQYMDGIGYSNAQLWKSTPEKQYYNYIFHSFKAHELTIRGNVFVNIDKRMDPIYFVSGLTISVQPVKNIYENEYEDRTEKLFQSYTRVAAGPVAGVGIFWDLGWLNFQTEMTIGAKFSIGRKEISETSFNISFSPVIRL